MAGARMRARRRRRPSPARQRGSVRRRRKERRRPAGTWRGREGSGAGASGSAGPGPVPFGSAGPAAPLPVAATPPRGAGSPLPLAPPPAAPGCPAERRFAAGSVGPSRRSARTGSSPAAPFVSRAARGRVLRSERRVSPRSPAVRALRDSLRASFSGSRGFSGRSRFGNVSRPRARGDHRGKGKSLFAHSLGAGS